MNFMNKTEAVLFLTKNEKADPNMGVTTRPKMGVFAKFSKYSFLSNSSLRPRTRS